MDQPLQTPGTSVPNRLCAPWAQPGLWHGFLGRQGGVSQGPFATLNLSYWVGDDSAAVDRNWRIVRAAMPAGVAIARLNQVHGATVHIVGANPSGERREGDGLVTAAAGVMLTILSADCVPILMADAKHRVVAALHAGWRGILAGIAAAG
ncbi:MAG: laccase domain-containing protein, partial [Candidatus Binataceae bacterium]